MKPLILLINPNEFERMAVSTRNKCIDMIIIYNKPNAVIH